MGRQIKFYMSNSMQQEFISFLQEQGFKFLQSGLVNGDFHIQPQNVIFEYKVYLYRDDFGNLLLEQFGDSTQKSISSLFNPVIEYRLSKTNTIKKRVTAGRMWITSYDFYDTKANRDFIINEYNRLVKWIKKNVLYQPVISSEKKYIDQETLKLINNQDYKLQ